MGVLGVVQPADVVTNIYRAQMMHLGSDSLGPIVVNKMEKKKQKKNTPRAQMMRLASFGPFFIFVGLHWPSLAAVGLCWPLLAAVGLRGLLWASSGLKMGVVGVVQPADMVTNLRNGPNNTCGVIWGRCQ